MEAFFMRLAIGALVIFLISKLVELLQLNAKAAEIINTITIIGAVVYIVFGSLLHF